MFSYLVRALLSIVVVQVCSTAQSHPEHDRITSLPAQPKVNFQQFSGFITVHENPRRSFFYYFVEAESDAGSKPLVLALNGGPGCSTLGTAFFGHGPFRPNGWGLARHEFSWNKVANMLYVDSPVGVGYSYSADNSDLGASLSDGAIARDNLVFLRHWLDRFPAYKNRDFFIYGHSYAGHYIPTLVELMIQSNSLFNLKAIMIGNPLLDFDADINSMVTFLWSHGIISDSTYEFVKTSNCSMVQITKENLGRSSPSPACTPLKEKLALEYADYDKKYFTISDVILNNCPVSNMSEFRALGQQASANIRVLCLSQLTREYLNFMEVQKAFHLRGPTHWDSCSGEIFYSYSMEDIERSMIPTLGRIIRSGIRVFIASGDQDVDCPLTATRSSMNKLAEEANLETDSPYSPWLEGLQIGGWMQTYGPGNLTFATVRGGGHFFPTAQPERSLTLFTRFLKGEHSNQ